MKRLLKFLKEEEGVTALEYSLIAALIFLVIVVAVTTLGGRTSDLYSTVASKMP